MLDFLRRNAGSWIIKVGLVIIALAFVSWGGYSYQSMKASQVYRVDDHYITYNDYNRSYEYLRELYRRQLGGALSDQLLDQLNLKQQAIDRIINRYLINKAAKEMGLVATPEEVQQSILKEPAFQRDGKFNQTAYMYILRQSRLTPQEYESQKAEELTAQKLLSFVMRRAVVTDDEVQAYYRFNNGLIQLAYVAFDPKAYESQVTVDDKAVESYYQEHKERYREPEKRQLAVVAFPTDAYMQGVQVSDEEIATYYDEHKKEFHQDAQVRAEHILFRIAKDAPEAEVAKVRAEAEKVLELAKKPGADFQALARQYSQDPSAAQNGGDLGYFSHDKMVPEFADAAFAMKPGQISDLVRTQFGFHIIKVVDSRPEKTTTLEEAKNDIILAVKREKAKDIAYKKAQDFADQAAADRDIKKAAEVQKLTLTASDAWVAATDPLPNLGPAPEAMKDIFAVPDKGVSSVLNVPHGVAVVQVLAIQEPQIPPLEKVKDRVTQDVRAQEARELAKKKAGELLQSASQSNNLGDVAKAQNMEVKTTGWFSRQKPDKDLRLMGDSLQQVFQIEQSKPIPTAPLEAGSQFIVCQLLGKKAPESADEQKELSQIREQLTKQKELQVWETWLAGERNKARVEKLHDL